MDNLRKLFQNKLDHFIIHLLFVDKPPFGVVVDLDEYLSSLDSALALRDIHRLQDIQKESFDRLQLDSSVVIGTNGQLEELHLYDLRLLTKYFGE